MNQLQVIEHQNQRVLTTQQLSESYGTEPQIIVNNFNRNKERYTAGKHYVALEGVEKNEFINLNHFDVGLKNTKTLYLWTEKGAWLHAKSLNTDKAWEAYEMLVDDYYSMKINTRALSPELQMFNQMFTAVARMEIEQANLKNDVQVVKQRQDQITDILSLNPIDGRKKVTSLLNRIAQSLGGGSSYQDIRADSYKRLEDRAKCDLAIRQTNKRKKMALEGVVKSKIDKVSKLDVIFDDSRLTEIYFAIVKEMAIQHQVDVEKE